MGDRVVPVDAQRHQHVGGAVGDQQLAELDHPAGGEAGLPGDGQLPPDVHEDGEQAHAQVCGGKMGDEEVHSGLSRSWVEEGGEDEGVAEDDDGEKEPEEGQLLGLEEETGHFLNAAVRSNALVDKTTHSGCHKVQLKCNCAAAHSVLPPITSCLGVVEFLLTHRCLSDQPISFLFPHHWS